MSEAAQELDAFLAQCPEVDAVQIMIVDANGVLRGKTLRRHELAALYRDGRNVAGSILGLDVTGEDVAATGLVWDTGDADMLCLPVPGSLQVTPWLTNTGQVQLSMFTLDRTPAAADPRHCLVRAIERVRKLALEPVLACEVEFYLLRQLDDGTVVPTGSDFTDAYGLTRLDDLRALFDDVFAAARAQGLPVGTLMSEYAPGQYEITLQHRADALRAVDEAILFKRLLKGVAAKHGLVVSFMAKPFTARSGSGAHLHVSLVDRAGRNVFASAEPEGTPLLRHAIGGLAATAAESFLVFAPNGNSYRRFRQESYAPVAVSWGVNNRSVSLRIPAGPPESRHVEHRFCGADANLYLAAAAVLAGIAHGIEHRLDPGAPVTGNGYASGASTVPGARSLPQTWAEALQFARASSFLADALGPEFLQIYLAIKTQECARFSAEVTATDLAWYLRSV
jgi:glutamine synthetase